jgi:hypothetical protein
VKRKCRHIISSHDGRRAIYIDSQNEAEILAYINKDERHRKKFRYIAEIILQGLKIPALYDKEEINEKCRNVTAMKFFKGQENDRVYCKEIFMTSNSKIIVAAILYKRKKSKRLTKREINLIEKVGGFEYEI